MVQPLLDTRENWETSNILSTPGRPADTDVLHLRGKHFPISMYPKPKTCTACGYKTDKNYKQPRKKTSNYCEKCDLYVCKDCFEKFDSRSKIKHMLDVEEKKRLNLLESLTILFKVMSVIIRITAKMFD